MANTRVIILTTEETELIGQLSDLIHDHINEYELTADEMDILNKTDEILYHLYYAGRQ